LCGRQDWRPVGKAPWSLLVHRPAPSIACSEISTFDTDFGMQRGRHASPSIANEDRPSCSTRSRLNVRGGTALALSGNNMFRCEVGRCEHEPFCCLPMPDRMFTAGPGCTNARRAASLPFVQRLSGEHRRRRTVSAQMVRKERAEL